MNNLIPIKNLKPFTKFCCTIGELPTSYVVSLTYQEQLLWLCDYIKNTVIPAINNNANAVSELQNLYIELKNYVDNYFNNVNFSEMVNNKLDEMAEDGTLDKIINQNIFYELNTKITNLESSLDLTNSKLNNKKNMYSPTFLKDDFYYTISYLADKVFLYVSEDSINWSKVYEIPKEAFVDPSKTVFDISTYTDGITFYITYDFIDENYNDYSQLNHDYFLGGNRVGISKTTDFINWETSYMDIPLQFKQTFAPEFFIDNNNNKYILVALSDTSKTYTDKNGETSYLKEIYYFKYNSDFSSILDTNVLLSSTSQCYIDPFILQINNTTILLFVKNENTKQIALFQYKEYGTQLFPRMFSTTPSKNIPFLSKEGNIGHEAPSAYFKDGYIYLFSDVYSLNQTAITIINYPSLELSYPSLIPTPDPMRHFTICKTNINTKPILIQSFKKLNYPDLIINKSNGKLCEYLISNKNPYTHFYPIPNNSYVFYGELEITLSPENLFYARLLTSEPYFISNAHGVGGKNINVLTNVDNYILYPTQTGQFGFTWDNLASRALFNTPQYYIGRVSNPTTSNNASITVQVPEYINIRHVFVNLLGGINTIPNTEFTTLYAGDYNNTNHTFTINFNGSFNIPQDQEIEYMVF